MFVHPTPVHVSVRVLFALHVHDVYGVDIDTNVPEVLAFFAVFVDPSLETGLERTGCVVLFETDGCCCISE